MMHRQCPDFDAAVLLANTRELRDAGDVDQDGRFTQPQLHERHQAVSAGEEPSCTIGRFEPGQRVIERGCALVFERRWDHAWPP